MISSRAFNGACALFIEASTTTILRVVLVIFSEDIVDAYLHCLITIGENFLTWVYNPNTPIPEFTVEELGEVGEMFTLKQNLHLWRKLNDMCFTGNIRFGNICKIIPSLIHYWNLTKGGVDSGLSAYLSSAHSSPFKVVSMETVCWERLIQMACLSAHQICKYDRLSRDDLQRYDTFASIKKASQSGNRTFKHFLSDCMRWARDEAKNAGWHDEHTVGDRTYTILTDYTYQQIIRYYNNPEGRARRSDNRLRHRIIKSEKRRGYCCVCRASNVDSRPHFQCEDCPGVFLCTLIKQKDNAEHYYTNCFSIFHNGEFTLM